MGFGPGGPNMNQPADGTSGNLATDAGPRGALERVLETLPLGVVVFDRQLRVILRNPQAEQVFGQLTRAAELGASLASPAGEVDWEADLRKVLHAGNSLFREIAVPSHETAPERLLELRADPLPAPEGGSSGVILTADDVTRRAGLARRLAVSERLAALGRLAARVAHELNNPLDGILRYINLAIRLEEQGEEEKQTKIVSYLTESRKGLLRMAQILSELLEFSRSGRGQFEESNINQTVEEAIRTLQDQADAGGVTVAAAFRAQQMPVLPGGMLFQVCCNLIKNAIDAMPDGGRLTVTTWRTESDAMIRFEDTGPGLPEPVEQIFQPFFTTKAAGKGTGLGLAICKDYIERLHGGITAEQAEPHGAVFTLRLPLRDCLPNGAGQKAKVQQAERSAPTTGV